MTRFFPQGIAKDDDFCNRESERAAIKASIESREHIVLVGPRRYGKSSLIAKVLSENKFPGTCIDLFFVLTQREVSHSIVSGVSSIMELLLPKKRAAWLKLMESVMSLNPKLSFSMFGKKVEITTKDSSERTISDMLLALDHVADKLDKNCVVVFDEFQQIAELKENHAIEAAIRHAVERSSRISYIFCGSKRHLLSAMFSDKSRPLYHVCDLMSIDRISHSSYQKFLGKRSKLKWKKPLDQDVLDEIIYLTECHPYYVNALCRRLWRSEEVPMLADVRHVWDAYVEQQGIWMIDDLSKLTLNRRKVLIALSHQPTNEPQGKAFSDQSGLTPSALQKAINDLQKLDLIYSIEGVFKILDPALSYYIRKHA